MRERMSERWKGGRGRERCGLTRVGECAGLDNKHRLGFSPRSRERGSGRVESGEGREEMRS